MILTFAMMNTDSPCVLYSQHSQYFLILIRVWGTIRHLAINAPNFL